MYYDQVEFGKRIANLRKNLGFTQEELGQRIGLGMPQISRIERGKVTCSIDILLALSSTFGVSTDFLLTGKTTETAAAKAQLLSLASQILLLAESL